MHRIFRLATLVGTLCAALSASTMVLTFEGLKTQEEVLNYYNGGLGSLGSGPGPNYGITFNSDALAIINDDNGGGGNFEGNPSGDTVVFFLTGTAIMNVAAGFNTGFSFYYSSVNVPGSIKVYSGLNDTGTLLASLSLPVTPDQFGTNPVCTNQAEAFCPFFPLGVTFAGTAMSVDFGGTVNQIGFDNITLGSATPAAGTPEPATFGLLGVGLAFAGVIFRRRGISRARSRAAV